MSGSPISAKSGSKQRTIPERGESKTDWDRVRSSGDYVWDGQNDDDRPASEAELQAALAVSHRGRPPGTANKISTTVRFDADIVAAFRATGRGWQTRMNDALRDWLSTHAAT